MLNLSEQDLIQLNLKIQEYFHVKAGIQQPGLLSSVVQRPEQLYYGKQLFPDIYLKAASIFEALARWHVFSDLNKRTALIATRTYLDINGYILFVPLHAVRFSVKVADDQNTGERHTQKLIIKIAEYIRKYGASKKDFNDLKRVLNTSSQQWNLILRLKKFRMARICKFIVDRWLAIDVYPEYEREARNIIGFIHQISNENIETMEQLIKEATDSLNQQK